MAALLNNTVLTNVAVGARVGAVAVAAAPLALAGLGFTSAGVAAGSFAAGVQTATYVKKSWRCSRCGDLRCARKLKTN